MFHRAGVKEVLFDKSFCLCVQVKRQMDDYIAGDNCAAVFPLKHAPIREAEPSQADGPLSGLVSFFHSATLVQL